MVSGSVRDFPVWCLCALLALGAAGCAMITEAPRDGRGSAWSVEEPASAFSIAQSVNGGETEPGADGDAQEDDSFYDPFAESGEETGKAMEEYDPWEPYNAVVFSFNFNLDDYLVRPIAEGYNVVTPDLIQRGISNVFHNVRFVPRFFNNVFQGKFKGAGIEISQFFINTTFGFGGLFDPAKDLGLVTPDEDFGQTLGSYGVGPGPYLLLPFWPSPLTIRDGVGYVVDLALDPFNYLVIPFTEVKDWPQVVTDEDTTLALNWGLRILELLNERSRNLETFQGVKEATVDLYSAVRNAYLQKRANDIRE